MSDTEGHDEGKEEASPSPTDRFARAPAADQHPGYLNHQPDVSSFMAGVPHSPAAFHFRGELHCSQYPTRQPARRDVIRRYREAFHVRGERAGYVELLKTAGKVSFPHSLPFNIGIFAG